MTHDNLKHWRSRLGLGELGMAKYIGVPVNTYRKWESGTRKPESAPLRLFEVLRLVESASPSLHASLLPSPQDAAQPRRGRPVKVSVPTAPENAPTGLPSWMTGGAA